MANTRKLDTDIRLAENKLAAVQARELWPLASGERSVIVAAGVRGAVRAARSKSTAAAGRAIDTVWANAEARLRAEISALQAAKQQAITDAAKAKAARTAKGWW